MLTSKFSVVTRTVALASATAFSSSSARAGDLDFGPFLRRCWETPSRPFHFVCKDFTRDGRADVIYVSISGDVGLLRQIGQGRFEAVTLLNPPGGNLYSIVSEDLNGDSRPDLVIGGANEISVLLANNFGNFGSPIRFPAAAHIVTSLALGDLNLDGKLDLVAGGSPLETFLGDGLGGFTSFSTQNFGIVGDVDLALIDGDARLDFVASLAGVGSNQFFLGHGLGNGGFTPATSLPTIVDGNLMARDIDADGLTDVLIGGSPSLVVHTGNGLGGFGPPVAYSLGAAATFAGSGWDPRAADLDGDGLEEVIMLAGVQPDSVAVFHNLGSSLGPVHLFDSGGGSYDLAIEDIDGDGRFDALMGMNIGQAVGWLRGDGQGGLLATSMLVRSELARAIPADMTGDTIQDVVLAVTDSKKVEVRLGDGLGSFSLVSTTPIGHSPTHAATGRINSDAHLDVVTANTDGTITVLLGNGNGGLQLHLSILMPFNGITGIAIGDVTGDGIADVVISDGTYNLGVYAQRVAVLAGTGNGSLLAPVYHGVGSDPFDLLLTDLDGDGDLEILTPNFQSNDVSVLTNDGTGHFTHASFPCVQNPRTMFLAELTGDSLPDLLLTSHVGPTQILPRTSLIGFGVGFTLPGGGAGEDCAAADFSGDGLNDVVHVVSGSEFMRVSLGESAGQFTTPRAFFSGSGAPQQVEVFDANGDGLADVLVSGYGATAQCSRGMKIDPSTYCTAKLNSLGCLPSIGWSGFPSASSSSGFTIHAANVRNRKPGLLLYGGGRNAVPFSSGVLCLRSPFQRSIAVQSGGSPSGNDCTGVYQLDMNAFASGALGGNPSPVLSVVGRAIACQFWG
ncbi:MAG TPA: VCBS repeat-containing protein, partial [Planctomycetota bacterium]|nr:VCBS repeat-containing protein [Planctomycetota bacterium]